MTTAPAANPFALSDGYKRYALLILLVVYTFNFVDRQIVTILQEQIRAEFDLKDWQLGMMTGLAFAMFYTVLGIPIARLADRGANRVNIIAIALAFWSAMTALCGTATSFVQLLLYRIGVGVGEAGCTPPAHSIISDMFKKEEVGRAMGVYAIGIPLGGMIGLILGGWIADQWGWRTALFVAGLPGVALAIIVKLTLKEPPRQNRSHGDSPPIFGVFATMLKKPAFVHLALASGLCAFVGYGIGAWLPPYFQRSFGFGTFEAGLTFGLMGGITGIIGTYLGGWLGDRYGAKNPKAFLLIPAVALIASLPLHVLALMSGNWMIAIALLIIPSLLNNLWIAPAFAVTQGLAPAPMRAVAAAILLFVMNLIGLGLGPMALGFVSDMARSMANGDRAIGLRWSLILAGLIYIWACLHLWLAARSVEKDAAPA
jgi:MFS transporter, Spinster family, sphingosine-1-phosphate transporter